jgi:ATP-dependent DNA ligase
VAQLSGRTPASFLATDLLAEGDDSLVDVPLAQRRKRLERFFSRLETGGIHLSPASGKRTQALAWMKELGDSGLDGLVARKASEPYRGGKAGAATQAWYRPRRTAHAVVGGLRRGADGKEIASLLLGLYDEEGLLQFVGGTAILPPDLRRGLDKLVTPLLEPPGFTGRSPATESRAGHVKTRDWEPVRPVLVCEVEYDHFDAERFRHPPTFLKWVPRADGPRVATFDQVRPARGGGHGLEVLGL